MKGAREPKRRGWPVKLVLGLVALFLFILALQLMKAGARGLGPFVQDFLRVRDVPSALGFGWLFAYVVMSGSPVAAMSLTLYANGIFTDIQTFVAIAGSRLGASLIVLLVGFVYHLRGQDRVTSLQMGVLSLLVTYTIYLPAIPVGFVLLETGVLDRFRFEAPGLVGVIDAVYGPIVDAAVAHLPLALVFGGGLALIVFAFNLFDRALPDLKEESPVKDLEAHIFRPVVMFAIGFAVTLVTLSVSVSLAILVPLSAKGLARRENIIPYIMGANISTFIDTLFASLLLGAPRAFTIVLVEMLSVALLSLVIIAFVYEDYERLVLRGLRGILRSNVTLALFLVVIFAVPLTLLYL